MNKAPHFVLFSRIGEQTTQHDMQGGSWYFRLESSDTGETLEAEDYEPTWSPERLELLAVVRGLEALDGPSSVTLITTNPQISRAIRQGLDYWRSRGWKWERFGEKVPMKNADLWQRIDRALQIHDVDCRFRRLDRASHHAGPPKHHLPVAPVEDQTSAAPAAHEYSEFKQHRANRSEHHVPLPMRPVVASTRWLARRLHGTADALQRLLPDNSSNARLTM